MSAWFIGPACSVVNLWNVRFLSVWSSLCMAVWLWTVSSEIYILDFSELLHIDRNLSKSRPIPVQKGTKRLIFSFFWKVLSEIISIGSSRNFCFLIGNSCNIYLGKILSLIYCPKMFSTNQITGFSKLQ